MNSMLNLCPRGGGGGSLLFAHGLSLQTTGSPSSDSVYAK